MTPHLVALCFDASDPNRLARFWAGVLDREIADEGLTILPSDDIGFSIQFQPTQEQRTGPNQMHLHLTSTSLDDQQSTVRGENRLHLDLAPPVGGDQQAEVNPLVSLGATRIDIGQGTSAGW